jgi:hypothetical protein
MRQYAARASVLIETEPRLFVWRASSTRPGLDPGSRFVAGFRSKTLWKHG